MRYIEKYKPHMKGIRSQDELICLQKEKLKRDKTDVDADNIQNY